MKFLNKLFVKVIYSDASELNVSAYDMGESQVELSFNDPVVNRLRTATGTIGSLSIFVGVTATISLNKASPLCQVYMDRIKSNAYIGGTVTLYDDSSKVYEITEPSLDVQSIPSMNGTEAAIQFKVEGNLRVNQDSLLSVGI